MRRPRTSRDVIESLTPKEQEVLRRRFGIEDDLPASPAQDDSDDSGGMPPPGSVSNGGGGAPAPAHPPKARRKTMH